MDLSNDAVIHVKNGNVEYLQFRRLLEFPNVKNAFVIKPLDFRMTNEEKVKENYKTVCKMLDIDVNKLIKPNQTHTDVVKVVNDINKMDIEENFKNTDGLITNKLGTTLVSVCADCILLMFYDPIKNVIANTHSGWRGTVKKIAEITVKSMVDNYNCNPKDIICCICPSIRKCHFIVEKDLKDIFEEKFKYTGRLDEIIEYIGKRQGVKTNELVDKWVIDNVLVNKIMLQDCGLLQENIIDSGICSVCNSKSIHSLRGDGKEKLGMNTAIIEME